LPTEPPNSAACRLKCSHYFFISVRLNGMDELQLENPNQHGIIMIFWPSEREHA